MLTILAFGMIGTLFVIIYLFMYKKCSKTFKKVVDVVRYKIFFNTLLRTSIMQYLDISISSMIAFKTFCKEPSFGMNIVITILTTIFLVVYPRLTSYIIKKYAGELEVETVKASVGTLYIM